MRLIREMRDVLTEVFFFFIHTQLTTSLLQHRVWMSTFAPLWTSLSGNIVGRYQVFYTLEITCEPGSPVNTFNVQCAAHVSSTTLRSDTWIFGGKKIRIRFRLCLCLQTSVAIEIPVSNPGGELLLLNVDLEGDDLCGADWVLIPPQETRTYKVTFSPGKMGKSRGRLEQFSCVFHTRVLDL